MTHIEAEITIFESCWRHFVLGIVQGLTEFLPISSTAHLKVIPIILGWGDPGISTSAVIQLGSILAVITYFRKDLKAALKGITYAIKHGKWHDKNAKIGIALIIGSFPIILAGMSIKLLWPNYETSFLRSIPSIGLISIVMAILLFISDKVGRKTKTIGDIESNDGLVIGLGQAFALIPGISRSGITLTTSLFYGWERKDAARFSFLLGIPAITLAGIVELKEAFQSTSSIETLPIAIGISSATVFSWISIHWLLSYLQTHNTFIFVAYRLIFGIILLGWWSIFIPN